ncbi:MAG: phosphate-starvation-inducible PsiE family protein [Thainema sp.]
MKWRLPYRYFRRATRNQTFLSLVQTVEVIVSKILSIAMVLVLIGAVINLIVFLGKELLVVPYGQFSVDLITIFGLFLNILIALEILENVTAYLRDHSIHVELVVATSLIAVARKIIVLDFDNTPGTKIIGLAVAIFALSISYWIIRATSPRRSMK